MYVKCKRCGTRYFIKDELVDEKGVRVKCAKCGTVFIVRKRRWRNWRLRQREAEPSEEPRLNPEALQELVREPGFWEQFRHSSILLKLGLILWLGVVAFLMGMSVYRYLRVQDYQREIYAAVCLKYGYLKDAIRELEALVEKHPQSLVCNFLLAEAYRILGDKRAKLYYERSAGLVDNPGIRGSLLVRAGRSSEGVFDLEDYLIVAEDAAAASNDLGLGYLDIGDVERGLKYLSNAAASYPYTSLFNRVVYALKKNRPSASKLVEELYSSYPSQVEVLINMAYYYIKSGRYAKALQLLMMAKGEHRYKPVVEHNIRVVYRLMGDERYRAYLERDMIRDDEPHMVGFRFLLNPRVEFE